MTNPYGYPSDDSPAQLPMRQSGPLYDPSQPPPLAPDVPLQSPGAAGTPGAGTPYPSYPPSYPSYPSYPPLPAPPQQAAYPPYVSGPLPSGPLPPQPPVYSMYPSVPLQPVYVAPAAPVVVVTGVGMGPSRETSGWATASLICSIVGWVAVPVLGSLLAVIFGHIALAEIKHSNGSMDGHGLAITGLVLGYIPLAGLALLICLFAFAAAAQPH